MDSLSNLITLTYKVIDDLPLQIDVYPPSLPQDDRDYRDQATSVPTVVYFHEGGLVTGDRRITTFPTWLQKRLSASGIVFISADHRLLVPCTGHHILQDIKDLFTFLAHGINEALDNAKALSANGITPFHVNPNAIAVSGESAGGLCACLAVMHASPRPVALLSVCGMVGDFFSDQYLKIKDKPFFLDYDLIDPNFAPEYLFPKSNTLPTLAEFQPANSPPDCPRRKLTRLYFQRGEWLDYYTGDHQLSERLRANPSAELIPPEHTPLFPQFFITSSWPPTFMFHGTKDTAIPIQSSLHLQSILEAAGVDVTLRIVEGKDHLFDHDPDADDLFGGRDGLFDQAVAFLVSHLQISQSK